MSSEPFEKIGLWLPFTIRLQGLWDKKQYSVSPFNGRTRSHRPTFSFYNGDLMSREFGGYIIHSPKASQQQNPNHIVVSKLPVP